MLHPLCDRPVLAVVPLDLEETSDLAHLTLTPVRIRCFRHCEERSDEAIQLSFRWQSWIASLRSQ
jgi:hypothetical protein